MTRGEGWTSADELPPEVRKRLANLLLSLADNKRLLGMRYGGWILGAPTLEAGIACSAMAQDEWGHGRILYAMLRDFGLDAETLEHGRESDQYLSSELLDREPLTWAGLLALNLLLDSALSVQFEALADSRFEPLHYKVKKLLEEERFHLEHGRGWTARLAETERGREALREAFEPAWGSCLAWFGRTDGEVGATLAETGVADADPDELRARWVTRVGPIVAEAGLDLAEPDGEGRWRSRIAPDWSAWDEQRRRRGDGGPDARTLERVRGDRNRALLMD